LWDSWSTPGRGPSAGRGAACKTRETGETRGQDPVCGARATLGGTDSPGSVAGVLLGQPQKTAVLGHVVVVGVGVGGMGVGCVGIGTIVGRMGDPRIGGVAGVRRRAIQVANLQIDIRSDYNLFTMESAEKEQQDRRLLEVVIASRIAGNRLLFPGPLALLLVMGLGLPGGVWARVWGARNCCSRTTVGNCDSTSGCCSLQAQNGGIVQGICIHKMIMVHELLFNRAKFTETFKRAKAAESSSYCIYKTTRQTEYQ